MGGDRGLKNYFGYVIGILLSMIVIVIGLDMLV